MKTKLLSLLLLSTFIVQSQDFEASLLEINFLEDGDPESLVSAGDRFYFLGDNGQTGHELWTSDGTQGGTLLIKDIINGSQSGFDDSTLLDSAYLNGVFYFSANDDIHGYELWRSDGTTNGTYMLKDTDPDNISSVNTLSDFIVFQGLLFFSQTNSANGNELWMSDGTESGTTLLKDINPGSNSSNPRSFFEYDGYLYFRAEDNVNGIELWRSDGTTSGTQLFYDFNPTGDGVSFFGDVVIGTSQFYIAADNGIDGGELWASDGTVSGTYMVKDIYAGNVSSMNELFGAVLFDDTIIFAALDPSTGSEIWRSDGTESGTFLIKDINAGNAPGIGDLLFVKLGDEVFFVGNDPTHGPELWKTDGTESGTQLVKDIYSGPQTSQINHLTLSNDNLFFEARDFDLGTRVFVSDGTQAGTIPVLQEFGPSGSSSHDFNIMDFNGFAYFTIENLINGNEIWRSDGSSSGTSLFTDINLESSAISSEINAVSFGQRLFFEARNGQVGNEPFVSDGEISGTKPIADINEGVSSSTDTRNPLFTRVGSEVFFFASTDNEGLEIHKTSLTGNGSELIKDIIPGPGSSIYESTFLASFNGDAYFVADEGINGYEIWKSDGTESGTSLLKNISDVQDGYGPIALEFNGKLYFTARIVSGGNLNRHLYRTDGTEAGTQLFNDGNSVKILGRTNTKLYFTTNDSGSSHGNHFVYCVNEDDTIELIGEWDGFQDSEIRHSASLGDDLYFVVVDQITLQKAVAKTDGTPNEVEIMYSAPLGFNIDINEIYACGEYVYFVAAHPSSFDNQLWRTDGTVNGTIMIDTGAPGNGNQFLYPSCVGRNLFYFETIGDQTIQNTAGTPASNSEHFISVINSNDPISFVSGLYAAGNQLYMVANSFQSGREIYVIDPSEVLATVDVIASTEFGEKGFIAHPNPSNSIVNITSINGSKIKSVEIINLLGKSFGMIEMQQPDIRTTLDMSKYKSGMYLIRIYTSTGLQEVIKVVKS